MTIATFPVRSTPPAPPVILTVTHDTGYPMRWYGPDVALTYDWLYNALAPEEQTTILREHGRIEYFHLAASSTPRKTASESDFFEGVTED